MAFIIKALDRLVNASITLVIITALLYSIWACYDVGSVYVKASSHFTFGKNEKQMTLTEYKEQNEDVCAVLNIENTGIDYPVLQGEDNTEYVNKGIDGKYIISGSIFIDCDNSNDFTDKYTLFYGHRMDASAMFGDIANFREYEYFDYHPYGELELSDGLHQIKFFACCEMTAGEREFFNVSYINEHIDETISRINETAVQIRDVEITKNSKIIALSTCEGATTSGRIILFGIMEGV